MKKKYGKYNKRAYSKGEASGTPSYGEERKYGKRNMKKNYGKLNKKQIHS